MLFPNAEKVRCTGNAQSSMDTSEISESLGSKTGENYGGRVVLQM